jgi:hypothetical protein
VTTASIVLTVPLVVALLGVGAASLLQWARKPSDTRAAERTVFASAAIADPVVDARITRARFQYGVNAGALIGATVAYVGYLSVVDDGDRGGLVYYAGLAGQIVSLLAICAIGFVSYPRVARLRIGKVEHAWSAGATADGPAKAWLAGQRRLLRYDGWLGVTAAVLAAPVLGYIGYRAFVEHDADAHLPLFIGFLGAYALVPVLLSSATVARRIAWNDWVFDGALPWPPRSVVRPMYQGIAVGLLATLAVLAALGWVVGASDPVHPGPLPANTAPPTIRVDLPPLLPSIPVVPTLATLPGIAGADRLTIHARPGVASIAEGQRGGTR